MLNIYFPHYEAFGGPLVNNLIGSVINGFSTLTHGFLTDTSMMVLAYVAITLLFMTVVFFKTLDPREMVTFIIDPDRPYINIITKGVVLAAIFYIFLKPIPVIQMTPVIGYSQSIAGSSSNQGDRIVNGWLVNDMKTTTDLIVSDDVSAFLGGATKASVLKVEDYNATTTTHVYEKVREMTYVPFIFWFLGLAEEFYYGFPKLNLTELLDTDYVGGKNTSGQPLPIFKYSPSATAPTILQCIKKGTEVKGLDGKKIDLRENLIAMETSLKARIEIDNLKQHCADNFSPPSGQWYKSAHNSLASMLFGPAIFSEGLSDFFEPVDRMFSYLSMNYYDELLIKKLAVDHDTSLLDIYTTYNYPSTPIAEQLKGILHDYNELTLATNDATTNKIGEIKRKSITKIKMILGKFSEKLRDDVSAVESKEFLKILFYEFTSQKIPEIWRLNISPSQNEVTKPTVDAIKEAIADAIDSLPSSTSPIRAAEMNYLSENYGKPGSTFGEIAANHDLTKPAAVHEDNAEKLYVQLLDIVAPTAPPTVGYPSFQNFTFHSDFYTDPTDAKVKVKDSIEALNTLQGLNADNKIKLLSNLVVSQYLADFDGYLEAVIDKLDIRKTYCEQQSDIPACKQNIFMPDDNDMTIVFEGNNMSAISIAGLYPAFAYSGTPTQSLNFGNLDYDAIPHSDDKTQTIYLPSQQVTSQPTHQATIQNTGFLAKEPPILRKMLGSGIWDASITNSDEKSNLIQLLSKKYNNLPPDDILSKNLLKPVLEILNHHNTTQTIVVNLSSASLMNNSGEFSNWTSDATMNTNISNYFKTEICNAVVGTVSGGNCNLDFTVLNATPQISNPNLRAIKQFIAHFDSHHFIIDNNANDLVTNNDSCLWNQNYPCKINTYKSILADLIFSGTQPKLDFINSLTSVLTSLRNFSDVKGCSKGTPVCMVVFKPDFQQKIIAAVSPSAGPHVINANDGIVATINKMLSIDAENLKDDVNSSIQNATLQSSAFKSSVIGEDETSAKTKLAECNDKIKALKNSNAPHFFAQGNIVYTDANGTKFSTRQCKILDSGYNTIKKDRIKVDEINFAASMGVSSLTKMPAQKEISYFFNALWKFVSYPLDFLREFQNVAFIKVSSMSLLTPGIYQPQGLMGSYPIINRPAAHEIRATNYSSSSSQGSSSPSVNDSSDGNAMMMIKYLYKAPIFGDYSLQSAIESDVAEYIFWAVLLTIIFFTASFVAAFFVLLGLIVKLLIYIIRPTFFLIILGVISGVVGLFRASIILPTSFILNFIASDFSRYKGSFEFDKIKSMESLFNSFGLLDFKMQFMLAIRQLSIWMVATFVIFLLLYIDFKILASWQEAAIIKAWIGSVTGNTFVYWTALMVIILSALLYGYMINEAYKRLYGYMQTTVMNDPVMQKMTTMLDQQTRMQSKIEKG